MSVRLKSARLNAVVRRMGASHQTSQRPPSAFGCMVKWVS